MEKGADKEHQLACWGQTCLNHHRLRDEEVVFSKEIECELGLKMMEAANMPLMILGGYLGNSPALAAQNSKVVVAKINK